MFGSYPRWTLMLTMGILLVAPTAGLLLFAGWPYAVYGLAQDSLIAANLAARIWRPSSVPQVVKATWWTLGLALLAAAASLALAAPLVLLLPAGAATLVGVLEFTVIAQRER